MIHTDEKGQQTRRRQFSGTVLRVSSSKTIAVLVKTVAMHPKYRKQYAKTKTYLVHDEAGEAMPGDRVLFEECKPISKMKRWRLLNRI